MGVMNAFLGKIIKLQPHLLVYCLQAMLLSTDGTLQLIKHVIYARQRIPIPVEGPALDAHVQTTSILLDEKHRVTIGAVAGFFATLFAANQAAS